MKNKGFMKTQLVNYGFAFVMLLIGIFLFAFPSYGLSTPVLFLSTMFMILAIFCLIAYFIDRKEGMYEFLFSALIYVIAGVFLFLCQNKQANVILGSGLLIAMMLTIANKSHYALVLKTKKDSAWGIKFVTAFLTAFLSGLVISNLYREITPVQTLIFGYFFVTYGIINALEPSLIFLFKSESFDEKMKSLFNVANETKEKKQVKSVPTKKIKIEPKVKKVVKKKTIPKKSPSKSLTKKK